MSTPVDVQWVPVSPTNELYAEYYAPEEGMPTVVLLHGHGHCMNVENPANFVTKISSYLF